MLELRPRRPLPARAYPALRALGAPAGGDDVGDALAAWRAPPLDAYNRRARAIFDSLMPRCELCGKKFELPEKV